MAAEKKTEAQAPAPELAVEPEPKKAEPAKKAAPVKRSKKPAWVARAHRARGVK